MWVKRVRNLGEKRGHELAIRRTGGVSERENSAR